MKFNKYLILSVIGLSLILSACAPARSDSAMIEEPTETMMDKPTDAMPDNPTESVMMEKTATPDLMISETPTTGDMPEKPAESPLMDSPAWFGALLTNINTGETFSINDFKGKVVLVETMAQWCPSCKKQQLEIKSLLEQLGMPADLVTIALDIDPNENAETLKTYAANNGFDWLYAIAPADVSREIGNLYGDQFLNPPSTPILIIDQMGEVHLLPFGIKSAADLMKAIEPFLNEM